MAVLLTAPRRRPMTASLQGVSGLGLAPPVDIAVPLLDPNEKKRAVRFLATPRGRETVAESEAVIAYIKGVQRQEKQGEVTPEKAQEEIRGAWQRFRDFLSDNATALTTGTVLVAAGLAGYYYFGLGNLAPALAAATSAGEETKRPPPSPSDVQSLPKAVEQQPIKVLAPSTAVATDQPMTPVPSDSYPANKVPPPPSPPGVRTLPEAVKQPPMTPISAGFYPANKVPPPPSPPGVRTLPEAVEQLPMTPISAGFYPANKVPPPPSPPGVRTLPEAVEQLPMTPISAGFYPANKPLVTTTPDIRLFPEAVAPQPTSMPVPAGFYPANKPLVTKTPVATGRNVATRPDELMIPVSGAAFAKPTTLVPPEFHTKSQLVATPASIGITQFTTSTKTDRAQVRAPSTAVATLPRQPMTHIPPDFYSVTPDASGSNVSQARQQPVTFANASQVPPTPEFSPIQNALPTTAVNAAVLPPQPVTFANATRPADMTLLPRPVSAVDGKTAVKATALPPQPVTFANASQVPPTPEFSPIRNALPTAAVNATVLPPQPTTESQVLANNEQQQQQQQQQQYINAANKSDSPMELDTTLWGPAIRQIVNSGPFLAAGDQFWGWASKTPLTSDSSLYSIFSYVFNDVIKNGGGGGGDGGSGTSLIANNIYIIPIIATMIANPDVPGYIRELLVSSARDIPKTMVQIIERIISENSLPGDLSATALVLHSKPVMKVEEVCASASKLILSGHISTAAAQKIHSLCIAGKMADDSVQDPAKLIALVTALTSVITFGFNSLQSHLPGILSAAGQFISLYSGIPIP